MPHLRWSTPKCHIYWLLRQDLSAAIDVSVCDILHTEQPHSPVLAGCGTETAILAEGQSTHSSLMSLRNKFLSSPVHPVTQIGRQMQLVRACLEAIEV